VPNPSKQYPWVTEMKPPGQDKWYPFNAYRDKDIAEAMAKIARKRQPKVPIRVRNINDPE